MFYRDKQIKSKVYWKCVLNKIFKRGGRVYVENYEVVKSFDHNNIPDKARIEKKELNHTIQHYARTSNSYKSWSQEILRVT